MRFAVPAVLAPIPVLVITFPAYFLWQPAQSSRGLAGHEHYTGREWMTSKRALSFKSGAS
jgi:hypothetical protein